MQEAETEEDLEEFDGLPTVEDFIIKRNGLGHPIDLSGLEDIIDLISSKMNYSKHKTSLICLSFLNEIRNALYQNKKVNFIHFGMFVPYGKTSVALLKIRKNARKK